MKWIIKYLIFLIGGSFSFAQTNNLTTAQIIKQADSLIQHKNYAPANALLKQHKHRFLKQQHFDSITKLLPTQAFLIISTNGLEAMKDSILLWEKTIIPNTKKVSLNYSYFKGIGELFYQEYDKTNSLNYYKKAQATFKNQAQIDSVLYYVNARDIAAVLSDLNKNKLSLKHITPAYNYFKTRKVAHPNKYIDASVTLATNYQSFGEGNKSIQVYKELIQFIDTHKSTIKNRLFIQSVIYNNISNSYYSIDRYLEAIQYIENAVLSMKQAIKDKNTDAKKLPLLKQYHLFMLSNLGGTYGIIGDIQKENEISMATFNLVKKSMPKNHPFYFASIQKYIDGLIVNKEYEKAQSFLKDIDPNTLQSVVGKGEYYGLMISLYNGLNQCEKGEYYLKKAINTLKNNAEYHNVLISYTNLIAECYRATQPKKALELINTIENLLANSKVNHTEKKVLIASQKVLSLLELKRYDEVETLLEQLKTLRETKKNTFSKLNDTHLQYHYFKAKLYYLKSKQSPKYLQQALHAVEDYINEYRQLKQLEFSLYNISVNQKVLEEVLDIGLQILNKLHNETKNPHYLYQIIKFTNQIKMSQLFERLNKISTYKLSGIPDSVYEKERALAKQIKSLKINEEENTIHTFKSLKTQYSHLLDSIKKHYPNYFTIRYDISNKETKTLLKSTLQNNDALLHYTFIDNTLQVLVVTKNNIKKIQLQSLPYNNLIDTLQQASIKNHFNQYKIASETLYKALLQPVLKTLKGTKIKITPDGILNRLNFETLTPPSDAKSFKDLPYLIHQFQFSYLYSYSEDKNTSKTNKEHRLIAFAPGFDQNMKQDYLIKITDSTTIDKDYVNTIKQPFSVDFAQNIANQFDAQSYTNLEATELQLRKQIATPALLHIGSHSKLNAKNPLFSKIILAKDSKLSKVENKNDGNIYFHELYSMSIKAPCTLLLSCETAVGQEKIGEGLRSLSHAFLYAGCPATISSLWEIDEKTSNTIVSNFYKKLSDKKTTISEALQKAKLEFLNNSPIELSSPYYWGGLIPQGEVDTTLTLKTNTPWSTYLLFILGSVMLAVILISILRKKQKRNL